MSETPNVSAATEAALAALKSGGFDYALIGGLAVILRGHDWFTRDVDALLGGPASGGKRRHGEQFLSTQGMEVEARHPAALPA